MQKIVKLEFGEGPQSIDLLPGVVVTAVLHSDTSSVVLLCTVPDLAAPPAPEAVAPTVTEPTSG